MPYLVEPAGLDLEAVQREWVEAAERQLSAFTANHNLPPTRVATAVAVGTPATAIVQYARDHAVDMMSRGLSPS
jgi:hypothetical protein